MKKNLSVIAIFAAAAASHASLLTVDGLVKNEYTSVNITYKGQNMDVYAGPMNASLDGGASFEAWCVDLDHIDTLPTSYDVTATSTAELEQGGRIAQILHAASKYVDSPTTGAAVQIAIWDVVANSDGQTNFKVNHLDSAIQTDVNLLLNANLTGYASTGTYLEATSHGAHGNANQNLVTISSNVAPVPEPTTMGVFAVGMIGSFLRKRRRA